MSIAPKQRRLLAARAAANFHDDVPLLVGVFGQKQQLNFAFGLLKLTFDLIQLLLRHLLHVRFIQQRLRLLLFRPPSSA